MNWLRSTPFSLCLVLSVFLVFGLMYSPPAASALPSWVQSPPDDTDQYLHGIGQSTSREAAINGALKEIAGKVSTWIKGGSEQSVTEEDGSVKSSFEKTVKSKVQDISFNNYDVEKTTESAGLTYVLVRVNRQQLIDNITAKLEEINKDLANVYGQVGDNPGLQELFRMQESMSKIRSAEEFVKILRSLDSDFDASVYNDRYRAYRNVLRETRTNIKIVITAPSKLQPLADHLSKRLAEKDFNTSIASSPPSGKAHLKITGDVTCNEYFDDKNIELEVWLEALDGEGTQLSKTNFSSSGTSMSSYEDALKVAIDQTLEDVKSTDMNEIMGF